MKAMSRSAIGRQLRRRQRGGVAIMLGLSLIVLIGFIGLAIDLGRFFVIKSELQNAMDACALSAASQLKPGANDPNALTNSVAYGKVFITGGVAGAGKAGNDPNIQNKVNFQSFVPDGDVIQISFSATNNGTYANAATADPNTAKFVKCSYPLAGLPIYFMRVLNPLLDTQTVAASAVATREAPISSCIPIAVCANPISATPSSPFGYPVGWWLTAVDGSNNNLGPGKFGWASLSGSGSTPDLEEQMKGSTPCDISTTNRTVDGSGVKTAVYKAWNSRFGVYPKNDHLYNSGTAIPDRTGYSYSDEVGGNWPPIPPATQGFGAYSGTNLLSPTVPNYEAAIAVYRPFNTVIPPNPSPPKPQPPNFPISPNNPDKFDPTSQADHQSYGRSGRRIVAAPVLNCAGWGGGSGSPQILGFACVLMLNPLSQPQVTAAKIEYLGVASDLNSPCGGGSEYAIAPVLAQ